MPYTCISKRAMQARFQTVNFRMCRPWPVPADHLVEKHASSRHRAHRMRTGRPNANLVKIENRQKHSTPSAAVIRLIDSWSQRRSRFARSSILDKNGQKVANAESAHSYQIVVGKDQRKRNAEMRHQISGIRNAA